MKVNINAEIDGTEVIDQYVLLMLKGQNLAVKAEEVKAQVWSEKAQKYIDFKPEQIKFVFTR